MYAAAPNFSNTGSHSDVVRKEKPYRCIAGHASMMRSRMIPARSAWIIAVAATVAMKKTRSPGPAPALSWRWEPERRALSDAMSAARERRLATSADRPDELLAPRDDLLRHRSVAQFRVEALGIVRPPPEEAG